MPFRDSEIERGPAPIDPLERFFAIEAALDQDRGLLGDRVPLRLVAANLVRTPGEPDAIAATLRSLREQIDQHVAWHSGVTTSLRPLLASILLQRGDSAAAFFAEVERCRTLLRELGMRRAEAYEVMAITVLRSRSGLATIQHAQLERMRDIYEAMKIHHWWLTGPEDYPACAFLVGEPGTPAELAERASTVYDALRRQANLWRGDPLQTAANILSLAKLRPDELAQRFRELAEAFDQAAYGIGQQEYHEVALLCFLAQPIERIIEAVLDYRERMHERLRWLTGSLSFSLASNLAFVRLVGRDIELGTLADAKALFDMQTIIDARQAATATT